jgi:hypothetical protein
VFTTPFKLRYDVEITQASLIPTSNVEFRCMLCGEKIVTKKVILVTTGNTIGPNAVYGIKAIDEGSLNSLCYHMRSVIISGLAPTVALKQAILTPSVLNLN